MSKSKEFSLEGRNCRITLKEGDKSLTSKEDFFSLTLEVKRNSLPQFSSEKDTSKSEFISNHNYHCISAIPTNTNPILVKKMLHDFVEKSDCSMDNDEYLIKTIVANLTWIFPPKNYNSSFVEFLGKKYSVFFVFLCGTWQVITHKGAVNRGNAFAGITGIKPHKELSEVIERTMDYLKTRDDD